MRRFVSKQEFLNIVGTWEGEDSGPVIDWLKEQGPAKYVYMVQTEEPEDMRPRLRLREAALDSTGDTQVPDLIPPRKMLAVLGTGYYRHWSFDNGATVAVRDDGLLTEVYDGQLENSYDEVPE